jgi:hypothetical protein
MKGVYVGIEAKCPNMDSILEQVGREAYYKRYSERHNVGYTERSQVKQGRAGRV